MGYIFGFSWYFYLVSIRVTNTGIFCWHQSVLSSLMMIRLHHKLNQRHLLWQLQAQMKVDHPYLQDSLKGTKSAKKQRSRIGLINTGQYWHQDNESRIEKKFARFCYEKYRSLRWSRDKFEKLNRSSFIFFLYFYRMPKRKDDRVVNNSKKIKTLSTRPSTNRNKISREDSRVMTNDQQNFDILSWVSFLGFFLICATLILPTNLRDSRFLNTIFQFRFGIKKAETPSIWPIFDFQINHYSLAPCRCS